MVQGLQSRWATSKSSHRKGRRPLLREDREVGRAVVNRVPGFSLAESLLEKKRSLSFSHWALLSPQGMSAPSSGLPTLFNLGFCLLIFSKINCNWETQQPVPYAACQMAWHFHMCFELPRLMCQEAKMVGGFSWGPELKLLSAEAYKDCKILPTENHGHSAHLQLTKLVPTEQPIGRNLNDVS